MTKYQATEEELDDEYDSRSTRIALPLRDSILIGDCYQAVIPELEHGLPETPEMVPVWRPPSHMSDRQIRNYLLAAKQVDPLSDEEVSLKVLYENGYDELRALDSLPGRTTRPVPWSVSECRSFEAGLRTHGKDFGRIAASLKGRTIAQSVQFYYAWKKSERRDVFAFVEQYGGENEPRDLVSMFTECMVYDKDAE